MAETEILYVDHDRHRYFCEASTVRDDRGAIESAEVKVSDRSEILATIQVFSDRPCKNEPQSPLWGAVANKVRDQIIVPQRPVLREASPDAFAQFVMRSAEQGEAWSSSLEFEAWDVARWALGEPALEPESALEFVDAVARVCGYSSATDAGGSGEDIVLLGASARAKLRLERDITPGEFRALASLRAGAQGGPMTAKGVVSYHDAKRQLAAWDIDI